MRVRSREEILATLDARGELQRLPFMPEMLRFCGQRLQVAASAHKTCDTANKTGGRRMERSVHLAGARCDGAVHGGCQAACLLFWKEEWLVPDGAPADPQESAPAVAAAAAAGPDVPGVLGRAACDRSADPPTYSCQATRLYAASAPLSPFNPLQYLADVRSGNVPAREAARYLLLQGVFHLRSIGVGYRFFSAIYEWLHRQLTGRAGPFGPGGVPAGTQTPERPLHLSAGEYVVVRPHREILATIDARGMNRGMSFGEEMVRFCGQRLRVVARIERIINEATGRMMHFSNPSVTLEGAYCTSQYSQKRLLCPRRITPYWREIWLERAPAAATEPDQSIPATAPSQVRDRS
ncbi:MAG: hypothetical protein JSR67_11285 [Proteobacteria bacterium]|nr:hypothetical protein [Pseudomonadota bacterium]